MILERVTPESVGIHSEGILKFIDLAESRGLELHSMMLLRHGKVCAEGWWKPYNPASPHMMFSFTKALTSTAIGFACQEGALSLDDRLSELFPDKMPENPSENLLACTVRDLLTMSCGHETEINTFDVNEPDWIKNFLSHEFKYKPGTCFMYNTAGTNMLCAALKRRTGENLFEYLTPRLLSRSAWRILSASACRTALKWAARAPPEDRRHGALYFVCFPARQVGGQAAFKRRMVRHGERKSGLDDQSGE